MFPVLFVLWVIYQNEGRVAVLTPPGKHDNMHFGNKKRNYSVYASGGPAGDQTFETFDKQV